MTIVTGRKALCLPVRADVNRFVWDKSQPGALEDLPAFEDLADYFEEHYDQIDSHVEFRGLTITTHVFVPRDVDDSTYAIIDQSLFDWSPKTLTGSTSQFINGLRNWLEKNVSYGDAGPLGTSTRIKTEFVDPLLEIWNKKGSSGEIVGWREILNRSRAVLLGDAGSGKTTLLRMIALHEVNRPKEMNWWRIPVYIALREASSTPDLLGTVHSVLAQQSGIKSERQPGIKSGSELNQVLSSGRLLLLLDGLDEIADDSRNDWGSEISRTANEWPNLGIYITTRQSGYSWHFPGFLHAKIRPFDNNQIRSWLQCRVTRSSPFVASRLMSACTVDNDLKNLVSVPLMLALLASVYERTGSLPRRKVDIIARYLDVVLESWDASRGVRRYTHDILKEEKAEALSLIAWEAWHANKLSFTEDKFYSVQNSLPHLTAKHLLRDSGCLEHTGKESEWEFKHEVFRDYLCALYLVARPDNVMNAIKDKAEQEGSLRVWRYACGITTDATLLFDALINNSRMPGYQRAKWLMLALSDGVTAPSEVLKRAAKAVIDELEQEASKIQILEIDMAEAMWRMTLKGPPPAVEAVAEIISMFLGGGWANVSLWWADYSITTKSTLTRTLSQLLHTSWEIYRQIDPSNNTLSLRGAQPYGYGKQPDQQSHRSKGEAYIKRKQASVERRKKFKDQFSVGNLEDRLERLNAKLRERENHLEQLRRKLANAKDADVRNRISNSMNAERMQLKDVRRKIVEIRSWIAKENKDRRK